MKSFAEFKQNINEAQMKMSYREWLNKTGKNHSPENVELYKKTQTEEVELDEINERAVNKIKNALGITSKGEPDHKTAPKWATHIGRTHEGAYHWLSSHSVVEKPNHNRYFPDAHRTQFTGHLDQKPGPGFVKELQHTKKRSTANEEVELEEAKRPISKEDIIKLLVKYGNNPVSAKRMVDKEFEYAIKSYPDATASKIAEIIRVVSEENQTEEVEMNESAGYIKVNMSQMKKWKVYSDNVKEYDQIMKNKGEISTLDTRPYEQHLNDFNIFYTKRKLTKEEVELDESADFIQQHLADKDINSKVEGNTVKVHSSDVAAAKRHLAKAGYKNHKVVGGLNEAYAVTLHHTYPDGKKEDFHYKIKSAKSNKHAARIARLIHVKKNIPTKLISFEPSKDVKLIEHPELEESRGHKILSTALARMNTRKKIASGEIKVGVTRDEPSTHPTDEKKDKSEFKTVKETNDMLTYSEFVAMLDEGKADDIKDLLAAMREKRLSSYDFSKEKDEKKPGRTVYRSKKYGNGDEDDDESKSETQSTVKRGRGRPKGSKSGARV